jgi:hypothetical protein
VLEGHPVFLKSCKLKECESHNSTFDKKMLAILKVVVKSHPSTYSLHLQHVDCAFIVEYEFNVN